MLLPVGLLPEGARAEISHARGGRGVILRISELGFYPGSHIKMIRNVKAGPVLLELKGCRIAIGRGIAMKIFCKQIETPITGLSNPLQRSR